MSTYRFQFNGTSVTSVEEYDDGIWKVEKFNNKEVWTYDPASNVVTKTEQENGKVKVKTYTDTNQDGIYMSGASSYETVNGQSSTSTKLYEFTITNGEVSAIRESKNGMDFKAESLESNEQWVYDPLNDTVTKTEQDAQYTETTLFVRDSSGYFVRSSETYTLPDGNSINAQQQSDDILYGKDTDDLIKSGNGDDYIESYDGKDIIYGENGNDYIFTGAGDDKGYGGQGDDLFEENAQSGNDLYDGGSGSDTVKFSFSSMQLSVDLAKKTASGEEIGADKLSNIENVISGSGDDFIYGSQVKNILSGGNGDDLLSGLAGSDTLLGGTGDDTIIGGAGKDVLTGGSGSDHFVYQTKSTAGDKDLITDFTHGEDKIVLDDAIFKKLGGLSNLSNHFSLNTATDNDDCLIYNQSTGVLSYDSNGAKSGGVLEVAVLGTGLNIDATDFMII